MCKSEMRNYKITNTNKTINKFTNVQCETMKIEYRIKGQSVLFYVHTRVCAQCM